MKLFRHGSWMAKISYDLLWGSLNNKAITMCLNLWTLYCRILRFPHPDLSDSVLMFLRGWRKKIAERFVVKREGGKYADWTVRLSADLVNFWSLLPACTATSFCGLVAWLMGYLMIVCFHDQPQSNMHPGFEFQKMTFHGLKWDCWRSWWRCV